MKIKIIKFSLDCFNHWRAGDGSWWYDDVEEKLISRAEVEQKIGGKLDELTTMELEERIFGHCLYKSFNEFSNVFINGCDGTAEVAWDDVEHSAVMVLAWEE